jgi:hypothetical protein
MKYLEFWEKFQLAEQKAKVFEIKTIGFELYPMLRVRLYYQLAQELGIFDNPHPNPDPKEPTEVLETLEGLIVIANTLVVPFARKVNGVDPYSQAIIEALGAKGKLLEVSNPDIELDIEGIKAYGKQKYDRVVYELMLKEKVRDVRERWAQMVKIFTQELGVSLGKFDEFPAWLVRRYISECLAFKEYFKLAETKRLFIVNAYSHPSVVVGAKQAGVKVIEIQHGFISQYHPAYSYPNKRVQVAPNKILVWGKYWAKAAQFPKGVKLKVLGPSQQFLEQRKMVAGLQKKPKTILFTSQGALGNELMNWAIFWAKLVPDYQFTYRLHPNEDPGDYQKFELPKNLGLSHKDPSFLKLLGEHEYLVGGFSTTLYEGASFGLKVIVLPISGYENMQPAIDGQDMTLANPLTTSEQLHDLLSRAKESKNPYSYYAREIAVKEALSA